MNHEIVAEGPASKFETDPPLKEVQCGSWYYVMSASCDYCPHCGDEL